MSKITDLALRGAKNYLTSHFGWRTYTIGGREVTDYHLGADYGTEGRKLPLYPIEDDCYVYSVGFDKSAGYYIWIYYNRLKLRMCYFHMNGPCPFKKGARLDTSKIVGYVGTSGNSTAIHLHLGIRDNGGNYLNPETYAVTYNPPSQGGSENNGGDGVPYFKTFKPFTDVVSSQQVSEGVIAVMGPSGRMLGYNLNGEAEIVREYTEFTKSKVFEEIKRNDMPPNYLIISTRDK